MTDALHLEIRKKIYNLLLTNPGLNLSRIAELLEISVALADYHLYFLEENDLVTIEKEGGYKRYYIAGKIGTEDKKILSLLHQEVPLNIVLILLNHPRSKPKDIREKINISPALLTYYLKKLIKYGIIAEAISEGKNEYVIAKETQVIALLIRYKPNVVLRRFKDTWAVDFPLSSKLSEDKRKNET